MNYLDVPEYGSQNRDSGKERLYYQTRPLSALSDLDALVAKKKEEMYNANDRTYDKGEYVYDPATGKYTFVPRASAAAAAVGLPASLNYILPSGRGGDGYNDRIDQARIDAFMDAETAKDKALQEQENAEFGDKYAPVPDKFTQGERIKKDLEFLGILNPLNNPIVKGLTALFGSKQDPAPVEDRIPTPVNLTPIPSDIDLYNPIENTFGLSDSDNTDNIGRSGDFGLSDSDNNDSVGRGPADQGPPSGPADNPGPADPSDGYGGGYGGGDGGGFDGGGPDGGGNTGADGRGEARGGLNLHGKYYPPKYAYGGIAALAQGGLGSLGDYSDGGQLLRGPGDGVSDSIPASIANKRPARLADGEFVIPSRIVSELGNGSTEAGARKLYAMLDRIQAGRKKSIGKGKVAVNSKAQKQLPA